MASLDPIGDATPPVHLLQSTQADLSIAESLLAQRSPDAEPICQDKEQQGHNGSRLEPADSPGE